MRAHRYFRLAYREHVSRVDRFVCFIVAELEVEPKICKMTDTSKLSTLSTERFGSIGTIRSGAAGCIGRIGLPSIP